MGKPSPWTSERNKLNAGNKVLSKRKEYLVTDPFGNVLKILGITEFCISKGLDPSSMVAVAKGRYKHYKGWKCEKLDA